MVMNKEIVLCAGPEEQVMSTSLSRRYFTVVIASSPQRALVFAIAIAIGVALFSATASARVFMPPA